MVIIYEEAKTNLDWKLVHSNWEVYENENHLK